MLNSYICALDIGSNKLSACLAQIKKRKISALYFETMPSKGVRAGLVVDSIELIGQVTKLLKALKAKSGVNFKYVFTSVSGEDIVTKHSRAIVPLAERGNKVITISDVERVNDQARVLGSSLEEEIIEQIPFSYSIDSKNNIKNPLGVYSHRLEVDLYLICGKLSAIQSLTRAINQSGFEIRDLFFSGLATSKVVFDSGLAQGKNIFCDLGSDITELLFFENGSLKDMEILALGGNDFTQRLADELKLPMDLAEDIKRSYGIIGNEEHIPETKEILVKKSSFYKPIKQRQVVETINAASKSVYSRIKESVDRKVSAYEINNFIITGRTVLLEGFIEGLENALGVPVKLGRITNPEILALIKDNSELSGQKYLNYLTCLGVLCEALEAKPALTAPVYQPAKNLFVKAVSRFREAYQEYF